MSQLVQFHLFCKLPTELQNLIWDKYDNEVDPIIWHEFFYSGPYICLTCPKPPYKSDKIPPDGLKGFQSYRVRRFEDGSRTYIEHEKKNLSTALSPSAGVNLPLHPRVRMDARGGEGDRRDPRTFARGRTWTSSTLPYPASISTCWVSCPHALRARIPGLSTTTTGSSRSAS
ncbi:hypothetical protein PG994_005146 [Apiospora phragmitis]|uniref:Uncharacterized protein n=1 Tax=Apiospora phragmitis TaxID=2905665 RepID=A0ABR1VSV8_9PEZI